MKAADHREKVIDILLNDKNVRNFTVETFENHTFLIFEKVLSKLSQHKNSYSPILMVFNNRKKKPISNYNYITLQRRSEAIMDIKKNICREIERQKQVEQEYINRTNKIQKDTILYSSSGYEQTNIDFYVVLERTGQTIIMQKCASIIVEEQIGDRGKCIANPDILIGEPFKRRIGKYGIKLTSCSHASIWNGNPLYWSYYS